MDFVIIISNYRILTRKGGLLVLMNASLQVYRTIAKDCLNQYIIIAARTKGIDLRMDEKTEALYTKVIKFIGFSYHQSNFFCNDIKKP